MKSRIIGLLICSALIVATLCTLLLIASPKWVILVLTFGLWGCVIGLLYSWLKYVEMLLHKTSSFTNIKVKKHPWSLHHSSLLADQVDIMIKKFELAASHISHLGAKDDQGTIHELLKNDSLGKAIHKIRSELHVLKEEEDKRNWITQGLAKFSEILRDKNEIKIYGDRIIGSLVRYLDANQGALFIEENNEEGERYLEMVACYAYEKKKFIEQKIYAGQGILGQCMFEKDILFITDIPKDYVHITSGLGEATPRNVVVVPLMVNEKFYGVIELALFEVMKPYKVEFLRKISENIAGEISSIRSLRQTQKLLDESKMLTHELQQREEEMRQNMEELVTTQEQMSRKQAELNSYLSAINNTIASAEFDLSGKFVSANEIFLKVMGYTTQDLFGQPYHKIMANDTSMHMMWDNLRVGKFFSGEFKLKDKTGKELWLTGTFNPITTGAGKPEKVMMCAQFNTQEKERINDLQTMVNAFKSTFPVVEFSEKFACKTANDKFMKLVGLTRLSLRSKTIYDFIDPYYKAVFEKMKSEILVKEFSTVLLPVISGNTTVTYEASVSVGHNAEGSPSRIIVILVKEVEDKVHVLTAV